MSTPKRRSIFLISALLAISALIFASTLAGAASVTPVVIPGSDNTNKTCAVVMPGTIELKTAGGNPQSQVLTDGVLIVTITRPSVTSSNPNSFDWVANIPVLGVIVKDGEDGANFYNYSPGGSLGDTYLTTPNNGAKGISHISFCYTIPVPTNTATNTATNTPVRPTNTPTDTPTNTPTNTPTDTPTDTPTNTPTNTPTDTPTNTPTNTPTDTPTDTPTNTPTNTPTDTPTNTPTKLPTVELGQLKVCKESVSGIPRGTIFVIQVNGVNYNVPAGYCVLAGTFPVTTQVTIQETIPAGYYVAGIEVYPDSRRVSRDKVNGIVVVKIGSGVTEVLYKNRVLVATATPRPTRTPLSVTNTPRPTNTPGPTAVPTGRMQICKEAKGSGVSGNFTFRYNDRAKSVPVGACTLRFSIASGTVTITEDARAGYELVDIYTIPANRLVSKDINNRTVTVTVVPGGSATQTIVVFVNRAVTATAVESSLVTASNSSTFDVQMLWRNFWEVALGGERKLELRAMTRSLVS